MEVTNEMLKVARSMQSFELMIKRIIELHEQSKPKPEPFRHIDINGILTPVYVEPPTREPLSEVEILKLALRDCYPIQFVDRSYGITLDKVTVVDFARLIEQAHGIGVTND